jgi:hypothetical protein
MEDPQNKRAIGLSYVCISSTVSEGIVWNPHKLHAYQATKKSTKLATQAPPMYWFAIFGMNSHNKIPTLIYSLCMCWLSPLYLIFSIGCDTHLCRAPTLTVAPHHPFSMSAPPPSTQGCLGQGRAGLPATSKSSWQLQIWHVLHYCQNMEKIKNNYGDLPHKIGTCRTAHQGRLSGRSSIDRPRSCASWRREYC